jgi:hypothetical protein
MAATASEDLDIAEAAIWKHITLTLQKLQFGNTLHCKILLLVSCALNANLLTGQHRLLSGISGSLSFAQLSCFSRRIAMQTFRRTSQTSHCILNEPHHDQQFLEQRRTSITEQITSENTLSRSPKSLNSQTKEHLFRSHYNGYSI